MEQEYIYTPGYHGEHCRHNGRNPDYEIACDNCDFFLVCMPDWAYYANQKEDAPTMEASSDENLKEYLSCALRVENMPDACRDILLNVSQELLRRL